MDARQAAMDSDRAAHVQFENGPIPRTNVGVTSHDFATVQTDPTRP